MTVTVESVEVIPYAIPFRDRYVTANGELSRREMALLRIRTAEGVVALGEGVPLSLRGGADLLKVVKKLHKSAFRIARTNLSGLAGDDPLGAAVDACVALIGGRRLPPPAAAAIETAIFDLAAKLNDMPLWKLLGATGVRPVVCNATLTSGFPADVARQAESWAADGFSTFKLKVGAGNDVAQVAAVREAVGDDARIRVDANAAWKPDEAIAVLGELSAYNLELVEQPSRSLRDLVRVRQAVDVPVAADESVNSSKDATRAEAAGACDYTTVKLSKTGGMGSASGIARQIPSYISSALDGPVGIAAAAHMAQALYRNAPDPGLAHGLATSRLLDGSPAAVECRLEGDLLHVPDGPGLGVLLDEPALDGLRLDN